MQPHPKSYHKVSEQALHIVRRRPFLAGGSCLVIFLFLWFSTWPNQQQSSGPHFKDTWDHRRDGNNLLLNQPQCEVRFPNLFQEIDRAVETRKKKPITFSEIDEIVPKNGFVRAMIYDQQLYIIAVEGQIYSRGRATLQAIYRAIISSPVLLPNIEFAFNVDDVVFEEVPLWTYARRETDQHIWLIPDFGHWSWPETKVGTMREVQIKAEEMEGQLHYSWKNKIPKLLWRGATMGLPLRDHLIDVTTNKSWADVVAINWHDQESMAHDLKSLAEHCQYRYLMHTEGNSYSGRLKYLQLCQSVIVAHKMDWIQHHHPLMQKSGPDQNYVEVDRNLDSLEKTILSLQRNPRDAQRIALNSMKTFRERYLTPAAEVCYWRYLIQQWSKVSFAPEFYNITSGNRVWRGVPVESFLLEGRLKWDPY